jgi:hypothetical protein
MRRIILTDGIRQVAAQVRLTVEMSGGPDLVLRFRTQIDTQSVNGGPAGELTPQHAARYIAKYATKSAEDFGLGERRITPEALPELDVNDHVHRLVHTAWQFGEHTTYEGVRRWVHMIGFRGLNGLAVGVQVRGGTCALTTRLALDAARSDDGT